MNRWMGLTFEFSIWDLIYILWISNNLTSVSYQIGGSTFLENIKIQHKQKMHTCNVRKIRKSNKCKRCIIYMKIFFLIW